MSSRGSDGRAAAFCTATEAESCWDARRNALRRAQGPRALELPGAKGAECNKHDRL